MKYVLFVSLVLTATLYVVSSAPILTTYIERAQDELDRANEVIDVYNKHELYSTTHQLMFYVGELGHFLNELKQENPNTVDSEKLHYYYTRLNDLTQKTDKEIGKLSKLREGFKTALAELLVKAQTLHSEVQAKIGSLPSTEKQVLTGIADEINVLIKDLDNRKEGYVDGIKNQNLKDQFNELNTKFNKEVAAIEEKLKDSEKILGEHLVRAQTLLSEVKTKINNNPLPKEHELITNLVILANELDILAKELQVKQGHYIDRISLDNYKLKLDEFTDKVKSVIDNIEKEIQGSRKQLADLIVLAESELSKTKNVISAHHLAHRQPLTIHLETLAGDLERFINKVQNNKDQYVDAMTLRQYKDDLDKFTNSIKEENTKIDAKVEGIRTQMENLSERAKTTLEQAKSVINSYDKEHELTSNLRTLTDELDKLSEKLQKNQDSYADAETLIKYESDLNDLVNNINKESTIIKNLIEESRQYLVKLIVEGEAALSGVKLEINEQAKRHELITGLNAVAIELADFIEKLRVKQEHAEYVDQGTLNTYDESLEAFQNKINGEIVKIKQLIEEFKTNLAKVIEKAQGALADVQLEISALEKANRSALAEHFVSIESQLDELVKDLQSMQDGYLDSTKLQDFEKSVMELEQKFVEEKAKVEKLVQDSRKRLTELIEQATNALVNAKAVIEEQKSAQRPTLIRHLESLVGLLDVLLKELQDMQDKQDDYIDEHILISFEERVKDKINNIDQEMANIEKKLKDARSFLEKLAEDVQNALSKAQLNYNTWADRYTSINWLKYYSGELDHMQKEVNIYLYENPDIEKLLPLEKKLLSVSNQVNEHVRKLAQYKINEEENAKAKTVEEIVKLTKLIVNAQGARSKAKLEINFLHSTQRDELSKLLVYLVNEIDELEKNFLVLINGNPKLEAIHKYEEFLLELINKLEGEVSKLAHLHENDKENATGDVDKEVDEAGEEIVKEVDEENQEIKEEVTNEEHKENEKIEEEIVEEVHEENDNIKEEIVEQDKKEDVNMEEKIEEKVQGENEKVEEEVIKEVHKENEIIEKEIKEKEHQEHQKLERDILENKDQSEEQIKEIIKEHEEKEMEIVKEVIEDHEVKEKEHVQTIVQNHENIEMEKIKEVILESESNDKDVVGSIVEEHEQLEKEKMNKIIEEQENVEALKVNQIVESHGKTEEKRLNEIIVGLKDSLTVAINELDNKAR